MSIMVTGYTGLKKGKKGYRQEMQPLEFKDVPGDLIGFFVSQGYDTPEAILGFMQGVRESGFKLIRIN